MKTFYYPLIIMLFACVNLWGQWIDNGTDQSSGTLSFNSPITSAPFYIYSWNDELQFSQRNPDGTWKSSFIVLDNPSGNVNFPNPIGRIGIGTDNPSAHLEIDAENRPNGEYSLSLTNSDQSEFHSGILSFSSTKTSAPFLIYTWNDELQFSQRNPDGTWKSSFLVFHNSSGNVGIGMSNPDAKLAVNGDIHTQEVRVDMTGWPDFVFSNDYSLPTLDEVEDHIKAKGHLKDIPSEAEVKAKGINLGEMDAKLLQKIEELTLYIIEQNKQNEAQQEQIQLLQKQVNELRQPKNK